MVTTSDQAQVYNSSSSLYLPELSWCVALYFLYQDFLTEEGRESPQPVCGPGRGPVIRFLINPANQATPAGMATIVIRPDGLGTSQIGAVEDVYVRSDHRGQGYGRILMEAVIAKARELNLSRLELTSKPKREAANALYVSLGFDLIAIANPALGDRGTNFYRLEL